MLINKCGVVIEILNVFFLTDPSLPAGRRREIDNVMKKARASPNSNAYWDKKLLEVEAKDPNRYVSRKPNISRFG